MIETQGKGKKLTIIVGDKIGNKLTADGRSTKQMTPIVKDLLTNLNILNAQDKLELDTPYTNKVWLDKLGEAIVYNNFGVMQQQVKSHYKRNPKYHIELNKHVETSYDQDNNSLGSAFGFTLSLGATQSYGEHAACISCCDRSRSVCESA